MKKTASDKLRKRIRVAITNQIQPTVTVLSSLLAVEDGLGWIPSEAIDEVAEFTRATTNDVWGVASFYTNFRFRPPTARTLEVCWGPSCHVSGAMELAKRGLKALQLTNEGDAPDGKSTFKFNTCLGACAQAPVVALNHQLIGRCTPAKMDTILKSMNHSE